GRTPPPRRARRATDAAAALLAAAEAKPQCDVRVLIRSRAGEDDFLGRPAECTVTADEIELMAQQAEEAVSAGAAGVVIGALTESGQLDVPALETLRDAALRSAQQAVRGLTLTCHRAV